MNLKTTKKCKNCRFCRLLYIKYYYHFVRGRVRYCVQNATFTNAEHSCAQWQKRKPQYILSANRFHEAEENLEYLCEYANTPERPEKIF